MLVRVCLCKRSVVRAVLPTWQLEQDEDLIGIVHADLHNEHVRFIFADPDESCRELIKAGRISHDPSIVESNIMAQRKLVTQFLFRDSVCSLILFSLVVHGDYLAVCYR